MQIKREACLGFFWGPRPSGLSESQQGVCGPHVEAENEIGKPRALAFLRNVNNRPLVVSDRPAYASDKKTSDVRARTLLRTPHTRRSRSRSLTLSSILCLANQLNASKINFQPSGHVSNTSTHRHAQRPPPTESPSSIFWDPLLEMHQLQNSLKAGFKRETCRHVKI